MRTRPQIITNTLREHESVVGGPDAYSPIIRAELEKRLTEEGYLTCEDFDRFDLPCCSGCHNEPHYQMIDVTLSDNRHAWVCCSIMQILTRTTRSVTSAGPEDEKESQIWEEMCGRQPDPILDELHLANLRAESDEEKLFYCLRYIHHKGGRKRGHKRVETVVQRALRLPGRGPAKGCRRSEPPDPIGFCLLCGGNLYPENLIAGTPFHNCKRGLELHTEPIETIEPALDLEESSSVSGN